MPNKRGLGKNLSALLQGNTVAQDMAVNGPHIDLQTPATPDGTRFQKIAIDTLQPGQYQPRQDMDQAALTELADSIKAQGIIQPIVIRQLPTQQYEIIAGERRWRAAKLAGLTEVPVVIRDLSDEAAIAMSLIENIQREDLNPMDEAHALQRLQQEFELTQDEVAEAVGKSRSTITNFLRLLKLTDPVKKMLAHGDLEMGHARALLSLSDQAQIETAEHVVTKGLSTRETERLVRHRLNPKPKSEAPEAISDPNLYYLQRRLEAVLKTKVEIKPNKKQGGRLIIDYKDKATLEKITQKIS